LLDLQNVLSIIAIVLSCGALAASALAYRQATKASLLDTQVKAVNHVLTAKSDVILDGEITAKTVASIREAFYLSSLVFGSDVKRGLDQAHRFAFRLQQTPFDQQTVQDSNDKAFLEKLLDRILQVMIGEARLGK
jgi:hypothetical protein